MKKELVKKSSELLKEIEELNRVDDLLQHKLYLNTVNFVIKQHFGDTYTKEYERVQIDRKHTPRLLKVVREIIKELELELDAI